ncbi:MAG TPA: hypothetical protein VIV11_10630 [Kofleriaceae bacterium]
MRRAVLLIAVAACGRVGFDPLDLGHDEDEDGIADTDDVCPHVPDAQADGDGDRVGDACDPNATEPRDRISLFATMRSGDQPLNPTFTTGTFEQRDDSLELVGVDPNGHVSAHLEMPLVVGDVRLAIGFDVIDRIDPTPQNQFAVGIKQGLPFYYVELNESVIELPPYHLASITGWDGTIFFAGDARDLVSNLHPGPVFFQTTQRVGTGVRFEVAWPDEPYVAEVLDAIYQGGTELEININNIHVEIRWLCVITSS